jgi:hypothetical protein
MAWDEYTHFVPTRTSLWCPVCGADENKGCTEVKGLRFSGHNSFALGQVVRPNQYTQPWETPAFLDVYPARKDRPRVSSGLRGWVQ